MSSGKHANNFIPLDNLKFGRLTVISRAGSDKRGEAMWDCICECGQKTTVLGSHLRKGRVVSCGCYSKELTSARMRGRATSGNTSHGGSKTRLYTTWANMKTRCLNPKNRAFQWYGKLGVTICEEWLGFENFKAWAISSGYTDELTIDRIDPSGNYEPKNCRWIPISAQRKNQRRSQC